MKHLSESQKTMIIHVLTERFQAFSIVLFGTAAKETLRPDSDVDIAFIADVSPPPYDIFMTAQELADHLKREVDLVDFRQASTVFQTQIITNGVILIDYNRTERQYAFMRSLKEYAMLNEERSAILQKKGFIERGITH